MSIFCDTAAVLRDVASLFLPRTCLACGRALLESEEGVCLACRYNMPMTNFSKEGENPIKQLFENMLPIEAVWSMYWFMGGTEWQRIIHKFKYSGCWYFAQKMGEWLGSELMDSGEFGDVDLIVPIPLHYRRRLLRGYNQSEQLALGVGRKLQFRRFGCDCSHSASLPQTTQTRIQPVGATRFGCGA